MDHFYKPSGFREEGENYNFARQLRRILGGKKKREIDDKLGHYYGANLYKKGTGGDKHMLIKFDRYESDKIHSNKTNKDYPIYRVHGTALSGKLKGQDWNTTIFVTAKDMVSQVKGLNKGDIVNVTMKENGGYWNPTAFTVDASTAATESVATSNGGSGGSINIGPATTRLENLKVAVSIAGPKPAKKNAADYLLEVAPIADMVQDYVDEKGAFQFSDAKDGIPEASDEGDKEG